MTWTRGEPFHDKYNRTWPLSKGPKSRFFFVVARNKSSDAHAQIDVRDVKSEPEMLITPCFTVYSTNINGVASTLFRGSESACGMPCVDRWLESTLKEDAKGCFFLVTNRLFLFVSAHPRAREHRFFLPSLMNKQGIALSIGLISILLWRV